MYSMREDDGNLMQVIMFLLFIRLSDFRAIGLAAVSPQRELTAVYRTIPAMKQDLRFHPKGLAVESAFYDKPVVLI